VAAISALTGEGLPDLLHLIEQRLSASRNVFRVELSGEGLAGLHRLYELGDVLDRTDRDDGSTVARVRVRKESATRFRKAFPEAVAEG
jgi:GTP-binding protein HflX